MQVHSTLTVATAPGDLPRGGEGGGHCGEPKRATPGKGINDKQKSDDKHV